MPINQRQKACIEALHRVGNGQFTQDDIDYLSSQNSDGPAAGPCLAKALQDCDIKYHRTVLEGLLKCENLVEKECYLSARSSVPPARYVAFSLADRMDRESAASMLRWCGDVSEMHHVKEPCINAVWLYQRYRDALSTDEVEMKWDRLVGALFQRWHADERAMRSKVRKAKLEAQKKVRTASHDERNAFYKHRSDNIAEEIAEAMRLLPTQRLQWLASTEVPLPAIPESLFDDCREGNRDLNQELKSKLVARLKNQRPTHWVKLLKSLTEKD